MLEKKVNKNISGMTLIETLVVFSVGLVVIALALTVYRSVSNKMNVKNETENLSIIYTQTMDLFSEESTADLTNKVAIESGIIPDKMKIIGDLVKNTWGGAVTVTGGVPSDLLVVYERVPKGGTCIDLVRNQRKVGWTDYKVGAGDLIKYSAMKVIDLTTACKGEVAEDNVIIHFKYSSVST